MTIAISLTSYHPITTVDIFPRSHPSSPTPQIPQCSVLLLPPSLTLSFSSLGIFSAPPLVSPAPPLPHALAPPVGLVSAGCCFSGKLKQHRLQHHAQPWSVGAGRAAVDTGEVGAGKAAAACTLEICSSSGWSPSGSSGRR